MDASVDELEHFLRGTSPRLQLLADVATAGVVKSSTGEQDVPSLGSDLSGEFDSGRSPSREVHLRRSTTVHLRQIDRQLYLNENPALQTGGGNATQVRETADDRRMIIAFSMPDLRVGRKGVVKLTVTVIGCHLLRVTIATRVHPVSVLVIRSQHNLAVTAVTPAWRHFLQNLLTA